MSDLEDLWNQLPTGEPPTTRILAQGRREASPWRSARRPLIAVATLAAVGGAFVLGTLAGNAPSPMHPSGPAAAPTPDVSPVAFHADLSPAESCQKLLSTYVDRGLGQVTAWGWQPPYVGLDSPVLLHGLESAYNERAGTLDSGSLPLPASAKAPGLRTQRVTAGGTGTNVQENGVDEPDTVKTDGRLLVRLRGDALLTYDVTRRHVRQLSWLPLQGIENGQILLSGDTVVAVGADRESPRSDLTGTRTGTRVQTISLSDPAHPEVTGDVTYAAATASVYQHGDTVRMVLSTGLPDLPFVAPHKGVTTKAALAHNRRVVKESRLRDWLPGYDAGSGRQPLLSCGNVAVPPAKVGLDTAAVVTFSAGSPTTPAAFGLAGATTIAYESADHLYLASTPAPSWGCVDCFVPAPVNTVGTSYLFQFDLTDDQAVHVASGEVEGTIRDRWSMDESGGELRVLVGPSSETGNFSSVVTLERRGTQLVETGRLGHLGPNEEVKSVRWQDDLALVVTYRQIDPLYVVDLRGKPRLLSTLKVPGFSEYLNPLGSRRLVGVGSAPGPGGSSWGAQLGLFRTRNLKHVKQLDVWHYARRTTALAGSDPRTFTWLPEHRTVLTVIRQGRVGYLSILHLADGRLDNRMVKVDYGDDIGQVRTIGMPDGRVVLVTGDDVRFLRHWRR